MRLKEPNKNLKLCADAFAQYSTASNLCFTKDETGGNQYRYTLNGNQYKTRKDENGQPLRVIELKNGYCLNCCLAYVFNSQGNSSLYSVSMKFFDNYRILFRAEWQQNKGRVLHPQPHWHLDAQGIIVRETIPESFEEMIGEQESFESFTEDKYSDNEQITDLSRLHFYMCYNAQNHFIDMNSGSNLINWIKETMRSIDEQLSFKL